MHHQAPEQSCSISNFFQLEENSENTSAHLDEMFQEIHLSPGDHLFKRNENAKYLFLVKRGLIKISQYQIDGGQRIIRLIRRGEVVGLRGILQQPYQYDAIAMAATHICRIQISELISISTHNPWLRKGLYARWQYAIDQASAWLTDLSTGSTKARLAHLLLKLAAPGSDRVCYVPQRREMASMIGVQTETVSRIYSEFKREGYIKKLPSRRAQLDLNALRSISLRS